MRWCTRAGVHIDRAACAWLIVRFVDAKAEFSFVTETSQSRDLCSRTVRANPAAAAASPKVRGC